MAAQNINRYELPQELEKGFVNKQVNQTLPGRQQQQQQPQPQPQQKFDKQKQFEDQQQQHVRQYQDFQGQQSRRAMEALEYLDRYRQEQDKVQKRKFADLVKSTATNPAYGLPLDIPQERVPYDSARVINVMESDVLDLSEAKKIAENLNFIKIISKDRNILI